MEGNNFILKLYKSKQAVFTFRELFLLFPEIEKNNLKARMNYYVKKGMIKNPRRGIYAKEDFDFREIAAKIYTPAYISLETVLEKEGVIFQHYKTIFVVSYLTRKIEVENQEIQYRRIKEEILLSRDGVIEKEGYFEAERERAFLDALYLYKDYYFDNLEILDKKKIFSLAKNYHSKVLEKKVTRLFQNV